MVLDRHYRADVPSFRIPNLSIVLEPLSCCGSDPGALSKYTAILLSRDISPSGYQTSVKGASIHSMKDVLFIFWPAGSVAVLYSPVPATKV
jgi:hypothetical protein